MAKIHNLKIKNFRGIKDFDYTFGQSNFICLVGRGDSCKTSIIEAISYVLYPNWKMLVSDSDFFDCDTSNSIEIEVTLRDVNEKLLTDSKYGLYVRGLHSDGETICEDIVEGQEKLLTVILKIEKDLEPKWFVSSKRANQEDKRIETSDRASFNVFLLSDYLDKHFSWSRGTPLYSLLKKDGLEIDNTDLLEAIRTLREKMEEVNFKELDSIVEEVKKTALRLGVSIDDIKTSVDMGNISIRDGKIILHDGAVPLKLKGKGSKRITSIAIQSESAKEGILLLDEIEQGLEPDRVCNLVRTLFCNTKEQTFITTHSQHVVEEIESENIFIVNNDKGRVTIKKGTEDENYKKLFRSCPAGLYANRIIVCEGKTEVGFCRAIDKKRISLSKPSLAALGIVYVLGGGDGFNQKARDLKELEKDVCIFCDSDKDSKIGDPTKEELKDMGICIFDCEIGNNIEKQVISELPWDGITELYEYVKKVTRINAFDKYIEQSSGKNFTNSDNREAREAFYLASTKKEKEFFKRIDRGEFLGDICLKYKKELSGESFLRKQMEEIDKWIDYGE